MTLPTKEPELFQLVKDRLYTAVIGDVMDRLGLVHQFLPQPIRPLTPMMQVVGRAMPVLVADVFSSQRPFGRLTEALDDLRRGEVYLARGGRLPCAAWGEILTVTSRQRGAVGAVLDGFHRDTEKVLELDWPVFSRGSYAQDAGSRAGVVDFRVPIEIGNVAVRPGDLVVGDVDGVVVIPAEVEQEVLEAAFEKASAENVVRTAIEGGMTSSDAFRKYGVL